jgi:hypothetical protein
MAWSAVYLRKREIDQVITEAKSDIGHISDMPQFPS